MTTAKPVLYLLSGLPGSGKSTYARGLTEAGVARVSVDDLLVARHGRLGVDYPGEEHQQLLAPIVEEALAQVQTLLGQHRDVVFDHGLGAKADRDGLKQLADRAGATWRLLCFDAGLDALRARCAFRNQQPAAVPISPAALEMMVHTWERPKAEGEEWIDTNCSPQDFYSVTGRWWGDAESGGTDIDTARAHLAATYTPINGSVLELGCGYGSTAHATAALGLGVTGIDFSDRIDRAASDQAIFHKADFYTHSFGQRFDTVAYWDGFGLGTPDDQIALLNRIAEDLVTPDGAVLIEVYDPTGFVRDHGLCERKQARPDVGYPCTLDHRRIFDHTTQRAIDAWQEVGSAQVWHQTLQCYSPADFTAFAESSGLVVDRVLNDMCTDWSYLVLMRPAPLP